MLVRIKRFIFILLLRLICDGADDDDGEDERRNNGIKEQRNKRTTERQSEGWNNGTRGWENYGTANNEQQTKDTNKKKLLL